MDSISRRCVGLWQCRSRIVSLRRPGDDYMREGYCDCYWPNRSRREKAGWSRDFFSCNGGTPSRISLQDGDERITACGPTTCSTGTPSRRHALLAFATMTLAMSAWAIKG